jgi:hypothetical protein
MLDDVERRRFLVQPAGEDALPALLGVAHVELDEGAGQRLDFPRRAGLAGAQPDDDVAHPHRLAGLQAEVARQAVALVEQAQHRDPLRHRRRPGGQGGHRLGNVDRARLARILGVGGFAFPAGLLSAGPDQNGESDEGAGAARAHASSGAQAS